MLKKAFWVLAAVSYLVVSGCSKLEEEEPKGSGSGDVQDHIYIPPRDRSLTGVTDRYGPLVVKPGEFEGDSGKQPWSSWWFPLSDTYMFEGSGSSPGPLQKYDLLAAKRGTPKKAATFEKDNIYDPHTDWAGHCYPWSLASLLEPEPPAEKTVDGIKFTRGDLKALLFKTYDYTQVETFGLRFNGVRTDNHGDIFPEQFHKFVEEILIKGKQPFGMDTDPGVAIWNYPVYKVNGTIEKDEDDKSILHVHVWLYAANILDASEYNQGGSQMKMFDYTYDLKGYPQADGSLQVVTGEWTESSLDGHPDFVFLLPKRDMRASRNPEIDPKLVDLILR